MCGLSRELSRHLRQPVDLPSVQKPFQCLVNKQQVSERRVPGHTTSADAYGLQHPFGALQCIFIEHPQGWSRLNLAEDWLPSDMDCWFQVQAICLTLSGIMHLGVQAKKVHGRPLQSSKVS